VPASFVTCPVCASTIEVPPVEAAVPEPRCASTDACRSAEADGLRAALESRAVIEQAKGVLVGRLGVDPETAFATLRRVSQHSNVRLRAVAVALVTVAGGGAVDATDAVGEGLTERLRCLLRAAVPPRG
jgi:hypothetical protein